MRSYFIRDFEKYNIGFNLNLYIRDFEKYNIGFNLNLCKGFYVSLKYTLSHQMISNTINRYFNYILNLFHEWIVLMGIWRITGDKIKKKKEYFLILIKFYFYKEKLIYYNIIYKI